MDNKTAYIRSRISTINEKIDQEIEYMNYAVSERWEYETSMLRIQKLKEEREELKEMLD